MATTPTQPDLDLMKQVNRQFVTGVTVVTAMDEEVPRGLAVNAFSSISLDPPTVMVCVQRTSSTHDCLFRARHLAINILSTDQLDVVTRFAAKSDDKFAGLDWAPGPHGSPLLARSSAQMEVEIRERLQASTHTVFICRVVHAACIDRDPMVYSAGRFSTAARSRRWHDAHLEARRRENTSGVERAGQRLDPGRVISEMRRRIIAGEIEPGVNLSELALAEEFGVSRTPVREALKQLQTEGSSRSVPAWAPS